MSVNLPQELNGFDAAARGRCLEEAVRETTVFNLHCHSFFSYNGYGYSPTALAVLARRSNWRTVGLVDFDVLDGVDEFHAACRRLGLRGIAGMETRVFIPELADVEINSPGEPGIAYHLGYGFASSAVPAEAKDFAALLRRKARGRTNDIVSRVNGFLKEIALSFDDVAARFTPAGNVTERHVCLAYRLAAEERFPQEAARKAFWEERIGGYEENPVKLEALIRSKTMKKGGVGYVQATAEAFPTLEEMNRFVKQCGALPTVAWLNGLFAGEADPAKLLTLHKQYGAEAITIIPDRNWNVADAGKQAKLTAALDAFLAEANRQGLPVLAGTEMNAPGQKLADDFTVPALAKHLETFLAGADFAMARG